MPEKRENTLPLELVGRLVLAVVALGSSGVRWWCPLVTVPVVWMIWNAVFLDQERAFRLSIDTPVSKVILQRRLANLIGWLFDLGYLAYAALAFGLNMGHWYGWTGGTVIGLTVAQYAGLLRSQRQRYERKADAAREEARGLD